ncbi:MarR family winged helix-turn-helix transcriptional regulator [Streptomyces albidoflavus]|jgi:DNA-binding MarR family transcriptional regulator|uniref:Transcriptional regulator n=1 Tax=Streptomyces albidoflavus TaxID=1886 RepID=A0A8B3S8Q1_9ACTN|nr:MULTISPECIES: MarR family winged helix-turn-helix transcriptional regulator [Streptomyces]MYQ71688.1 MarR family transcriptional regulator [Streptomyces sp. SID4934]MYW58031.1 MarR family transcriptional regulator [Streptomyces sp. SID8370]MYW88530.1 MarR family transcriptional regulator [Streptomyces sp. SID8371]QLA58077.1 winged helix-turn-helix transcriptional regulator [Streptomyces violascens]AWL33106.1 MarR family transcriptional regulator [Streptomyces sp. SM17]
MPENASVAEPPDGIDVDVDAVTGAVLTASRLLVAISARSLAAVGDRVTLPQFRMLVVLSVRGPTRLVTLAEALGVAPSTAMRMVDRLIAAGLAERQANPGNRRETSLYLTDAGLRTVREVTDRRRAEIAGVVARLEPARRADLVAALHAFNEAGGEPLAPTGAADTHPLGWGGDPAGPSPRG